MNGILKLEKGSHFQVAGQVSGKILKKAIFFFKNFTYFLLNMPIPSPHPTKTRSMFQIPIFYPHNITPDWRAGVLQVLTVQIS